MKGVSVRIHGHRDDSVREGVEPGTGKGIHFICNGWVLSAQAGWGNYCSVDPSRSGARLSAATLREDCEIALWQEVRKHDLIELESDTVMGWVPWGAVVGIVSWLMQQESSPSEQQVRDFVLRTVEQSKQDKEGT